MGHFPLNEGWLQYYASPKNDRIKKNVIVWRPDFSKQHAYGEVCINGTTIQTPARKDFIEVLKEISLILTEENSYCLIHTTNFNVWLKLNLKSFTKIMGIKEVIGCPKIFLLQTNHFKFIELDGVIDYNETNSADEVYQKVQARLKDGVLLPQICFSYAYGSYRLFKRKYGDACKSTQRIVEKQSRGSQDNRSLYDKMKEKPSLMYHTEKTFNLFKANLEAPIIYIDRHDCWDYYLFTKVFPLTAPVLVKSPTIKKLLELKQKEICFDFEAIFKFKILKYDERIPLPPCFKIVGKNEVEAYGTEITFDLLKEYFKGSILTGAVFKYLWRYEKQDMLPEAYLNALKELIKTKHLSEDGSIEKLRAKEALKIQIGKGLSTVFHSEKWDVEELDNGHLKKKEVIYRNEDEMYAAIEKSYSKRILTPQISVRCQQAEFLHITKVVKKLLELNCEILNVDTDGIIYIDKENLPALTYFQELNKRIEEKFKFEDFKVGIWDIETTAKEFISYGKKQYVLNDFEDNKTIHLAGCCNVEPLREMSMEELAEDEVIIPKGLKILKSNGEGYEFSYLDFVLKNYKDC